jgi:hypothetical protein
MKLITTARAMACLAASVMAMAALPAAAHAEGRFAARGARVNAEGGISAGAVRGARNAEGSGIVRGRGVRTDGEGAGVAGSGACASGEAGSGCRGSSTTWTADGAIDRQAGAQWDTVNGAGSTQGQFTRDADGSYSGARDTTASGVRGDYAASTTVDSETGYNRAVNASNENGSVEVLAQGQRGSGGTRTVTCFDASGAQVACPN